MIQKLSLQILYSGPDANHSSFKVETLVNILRQNEGVLIRSGLYEEEPIESKQTAIIHKAIVTPAGIYLYGPERESNNRILWKYPNYYDHFLRVQFSEENGQPIHSNATISNMAIFNRFRKVLNSGIHIASLYFSFLGFSHSSLHSQLCWFMAPFIYNRSLLYNH